MNKYNNFMEQIPRDIMVGVETHLCNNIAIFKPQAFLAKATVISDDYHIIIPSVTPPDTFYNDKLYSFEQGKIVAVNPGDTIRCVRGYTSKQYYALLIKPELINQIAREMGCPGDVRFLKLQNAYSMDLIHAVRSLDMETQRPDSLPLMLDALSVQIAALLLREFKTNLKKYSAKSPDSNTYVAIAKEFIETFYSSNITISDICNEINVSPFHFIRTFKQKTGVSPHQYLMKVRIQRAKELLRSRDYSVSEVARLCGFVNPSHFSIKFKEYTGHSPSDYRKLYFIL